MQSSPPPHTYHTRIRQHSYIKPSAKARADTSPVPATLLPPFPPPGIVLHQDDATSKVFLAIARAFVSIDNRAMTIKDIAERATRYGLVCQNLSAAAQAVTTYVRAHKARCDKQQDHPLLLSHTLSGTPIDDDLVPALYSRSGGDSHPLQDRLTNFRKGTAVWYLSRATGVPCPFTRAGIRLCDYTSPEPAPDNAAERQRDEMCGEKRKRPLRGCATRPELSDNDRPPKIKLTLRLKPLFKPPQSPQRPEGSTSARPIDVSDSSESDSESMSVDSSEDEEEEPTQIPKEEPPEEPWRLPPYPRRSISIPCYTPSTEYYPRYPSPTPYKDPLRRSPSVPFATPPPDSDDEADDFHVAMTRLKDQEDDDELGWDADLDSEGEGDTVWESPGPRSPSAPLIQATEVTVKQEPRDVQGMLDAWEDFDTSAAVADVLAKALDTTRPTIKTEPVDPWDWFPSHTTDWVSEDSTLVKQEDFGVDSLFPPAPLSPLSSLSSQFAAFGYMDRDSDNSLPAPRPRAQTVPAPSNAFSPPPLTFSASTSASSSREQSVPSTTLVTLLQSLSDEQPRAETGYALPAPTPCVSPLQTRCQPSYSLNRPVVVTTCHPCKPPISATQIEDISVYQMMLGAFQLLRRIDTDFVNLSPILAIAGTAPSAAMVPPNAMVVAKGSPEVSGTWVPLAAAQAYVHEHLARLRCKFADAEMEALQVFLSDGLVGLFPPALQDFHRTVPKTAVLNQFGRHFASTLQAAKWDTFMEGASASGPPPSGASSGTQSAGSSSSPPSSSSAAAVPLGPSGAPFVPLPQQHPVSAMPAPFVMGLGLGDKHVHKDDAPLSATEQQLFHELCVIPPEWEPEHPNAEDKMEVDDVQGSGNKPQQEIRLPETPTTAKASSAPIVTASSVLSDDSPLSSPMSSPTMSATHMSPSPPVSAVLASFSFTTPVPAPPPRAAADSRPLRRSKRVADAALSHGPSSQGRTATAAQAPARARSRKGGASSRNSLS